MSVPKRNVKDMDLYWERLSGDLAYLFRLLQGKAEYGSRVSERGIQSVVLFTAQKIAKERGMNVNMVSALCQAVALCFPGRGFAELSVIREFIRKNGMDIALDTLEIDAVEYAVFKFGRTVTPELDRLLRDYYFDVESVPEVGLVRFLQKYLNLNRESLRECALGASGRAVDEIMKRAADEYETAYRLLPDPVIPPVPQSIEKEIEANLSLFIEYQGDAGEGIYEVITG